VESSSTWTIILSFGHCSSHAAAIDSLYTYTPIPHTQKTQHIKIII
jgi:hypothetical protein